MRQLSRSNLLVCFSCSPQPLPPEAVLRLGSVALLTLHQEPWAEHLVARAVELPGSVPLVVAATGDMMPTAAAFARRMLTERAWQVGVVPLHRPLYSPAHVWELVAARPTPSPELVARWLARRLIALPDEASTERAELRAQVCLLIHRVLEEPGAPAPGHGTRGGSPRHLRRWTSAVLGCRPSDLRRLTALAVGERRLPTVSQVAGVAGTTERLLRNRIRSGLGISLRQYRSLVGWEPVLEAAVRHGLGAPGWGVRSAGQRGSGAAGQDEAGPSHSQEAELPAVTF